MFKFRKVPRDALNDLEAYLNAVGDEPARWLAREVQSWNEFSYADIEAAILSGHGADLVDWQARYAAVVNEKFNPLWLAAIAQASHVATGGRITIDDSDIRVKEFLRTRAAELVTQLSAESKRAVANVILFGQSEHLAPRDIAKLVRPLIGLNARQAEANAVYRRRLFERLTGQGLSATTANQRAEAAAVRYASKQHRQRAETIVHTELSRAYNRGAFNGIQAAQRAGLMNVCEMIWSTAGTNRVCGRCLSLKDSVVGHTDEAGVQLPPLHPRCRCVIHYREKSNIPSVTGGLNNRNDPEGKRREAHAEKFYAARRNSKKEPWVKRIAQNSGMSETAVSKIFDHVFITEHLLQGERKRFDSSYYMAESFRRLSEGKDIQPHDLILLKHERLELGLMKRYGYDYDTAHAITSRKYNYSAALALWRKEHE